MTTIITNRGVDTARWDGNFQAPPLPMLAALNDANVRLIIHKVCEMRSDGYLIMDDALYPNVWAAEKHGLKQSGFTFWKNNDTPKTYQLFARTCQKLGIIDSIYKYWLDFEPSESIAIANPGAVLYNALQAMADVTGVMPGIYTAPGKWDVRFQQAAPSWLYDKDTDGKYIYRLWVAQWPTKSVNWTPAKQWDLDYYGSKNPVLPRWWKPEQTLAWQFTDQGRFLGCPSTMDLNALYPNGLSGIPEPSNTRQATATAALNVRSGPGTTYSIVGGLTTGQLVTAYIESPDSTPGWAKLYAPYNGGWVSESYLNYL